MIVASICVAVLGPMSLLGFADPSVAGRPGELATGALLPRSVEPYLALMVVGFVVGVAGHLFRSRWLVGAGIIIILLATLLLPLAINLFDDNPAAPGPSVPTP